mgnify:FL=1|tara:strand:- start:403 stop:969 length:567 start_codon:yes stop_codon:yes gene_type:complete
MSALKPVGINSNFPVTNGSSARGVDQISQQAEYLRFVAKGAGVHVAIGTLPTAATTNFYVHAGEDEVIRLGKVAAQRVVGVTTGTTTTIDFPEGTGQPFKVGDAVTLTGVPSYLTFTHKIVDSVNVTAGTDGYFNTRIIVNYDSSGIHTNYVAQTPGSADYAELRGSFMVAGMGDGSGTLHYQQVQRI